jgi:hypothetical protein
VSEAGRPARPRVVRVGDFLVVEAPVEQTSCESERGQDIPSSVLACSVFVGRAFGVVFSGVYFS